jgi:hypothetical protein
MKHKFVEKFPEEIYRNPVLISGKKSEMLPGIQYLLIEKDGLIIPYEIRYEYHCSPFQEVIIENDILAVGFEEYFYLFDVTKNENMLSLKMDGYFGHIYFDNNLFYVADARGLHCINETGQILWQNTNIAIDGVIIEMFEADKIYGKGELDPPGGWQNFVLDFSTGKEI